METDNDSPPAATSHHSLSIQQVDNDDPIANDSSSPSSYSSYQDSSTNDLTLLTASLLLTADCMGTGILALPADVHTLGRLWGIGFLVLNLPVNLYAGSILGRCALYVEKRILSVGSIVKEVELDVVDGGGDTNGLAGDVAMNNTNERRNKGYSSVGKNDSSLAISNSTSDEPPTTNGDGNDAGKNPTEDITDKLWNRRHAHADAATFDYVGMASMLFDAPLPSHNTTEAVATEAFDQFDPDDQTTADDNDLSSIHPNRQITYNHPFTKIVLSIYYINLFLVLGNYILVMSHAVSAMAGENNLCIPTAGTLASTLMFALSQFRTMATLGRSVSAVSLAALLIVVVQCLHALHHRAEDGIGDYDAFGEDDATNNTNTAEEEHDEYYSSSTYPATTEATLAKMSSLAAICFAVGSQKLLLNIRHEMVDRAKAAPGALSVSLSIYGCAYIAVCFVAGDNPPSFLFDAIPEGMGRRVGGFLLWVHVAVSYAINSQAFCSSIDRVVGLRVKVFGWENMHRVRWAILTALVSMLSYLIANGIPFFKDLVALCGAATSIPLTLLIPAIFYRRIQGVPLFFPTLHSKYSFVLVLFSMALMVIGLIGAIGSIDVDWSNKTGPFACH